MTIFPFLLAVAAGSHYERRHTRDSSKFAFQVNAAIDEQINASRRRRPEGRKSCASIGIIDARRLE